jgi:hypothetical protein
MVIGYGGLITLPFWMEACGISDKSTHNSSFTLSEQDILAKTIDVIIPAGNAIGALSVGVDKFIQKLIDDCYGKSVQDNVKQKLGALENSAVKIFGKSFVDCDLNQRHNILMKFSASPVKEEKDFFELMKSETIRGFNTSQKVMQDYLGYQVAPGHYYGCVKVKA